MRITLMYKQQQYYLWFDYNQPSVKPHKMYIYKYINYIVTSQKFKIFLTYDIHKTNNCGYAQEILLCTYKSTLII